MRSEERSGVIFIVMLFMWGTLLAEPFHIFVRYLIEVTDKLFGVVNLSISSGLGNIILLFVLLLITIILLKISSTSLAAYLPCFFAIITLIGFLIRCVVKHEVLIGSAVSLVIVVAINMFLYIFRQDKILFWVGDFYIFSIPLYVITGLLFIPLSKLNGVLDKIFYITNYQSRDLTTFYGGTLKIPGLVWGIFMMILWVLPVIYFSFGRKGKNNE